MKFGVLLILVNVVYFAQCYNILVVFPMNAPSHFILGSTLAKGLAEHGHEVTFVGSFPIKDHPKNGKKIREIIPTKIAEVFKNIRKTNIFEMGDTSPFLNTFFFSKMGEMLSTSFLEDPEIQTLLHSGEKFDAVIIEQFLNEAMKSLAYNFNAHTILFSTIGANNWFNGVVGNPSPPSYIPSPFLDYSPEMSFKQRLTNCLLYVVEHLAQHFIQYPAQEKVMKQYVPNPPEFDSVLYNTSLVLLNAHESINQPVPYVPNMVNIGGYHVQPPKPLPKDLQEFMDNAKEGVVYFSLGSNIKPSDMPNVTRIAIISALAKLKQKVLWKWDEDVLPNQPRNVKLSKWFPQQDVLAHPNIKLFITHGGLLSTIETVYHGVPILALPVFADQKLNAAAAEASGYCINLPFMQITESKLSRALNDLLNKPQYRRNVKTRSELMHDRPVKPIDLANYWVEFVIRHKGAPHLRVAGAKLPWYQYLLLDVIAFLFVTTTTIIYLSCKLIRITLCNKTSPKLKTN